MKMKMQSASYNMQMAVLLFALAIWIIFPISVFAEGQTVQSSDCYDSETLLVKLAQPNSENFSIMAAGADSVLDYGKIEKLFDVRGASLGARSASSNAAWYVLQLDEGQEPEAVLSELEQNPTILAASYNFRLNIGGTFADYEQENAVDVSHIDLAAAANTNQWYLEAAGLPAAKNYLQKNGFNSDGSEQVVVAVIDTGVDYTHPDLSSNILRDAEGNIIGADVTNESDDPMPGAMSGSWHGTHCAGIVAASGDSKLSGVAPNVKIMPVKVFSATGGTVSDMVNGIRFAHDNGAQIASMSLGVALGGTYISKWPAPEDDALLQCIQEYDEDMLFIAAAGNSAGTTANGQEPTTDCGWPNAEVDGVEGWVVTYPAAYDEVIGIMSYDAEKQTNGDNKSNFSRWDPYPDDDIEYNMAAPGRDILSTMPDGKYAYANGTSMATPFAAGCAALLLTKYQDREDFMIQDIREILLAGCETVQAVTVTAETYSDDGEPVEQTTVYQMSALRIDKAMESRRDTTVTAPAYQYRVLEGSARPPGMVAVAADGLSLSYSYSGDTYSGTVAPRGRGVYQAVATVNDLYYQGEATAVYTVLDNEYDLNADGTVTKSDMAVFKRHFGGRQNSPSEKAAERYQSILDYDGNGRINNLDMLALFRNING